MPRKLSFLPPWCLAGCPIDPFLQSVQGSRPWRPPQDLPRTGPFAIEIVLKVRQNPAPLQNRDSIGNPVLQVSLVPPWCLPGCPNGSFLPPWCLAGCPIDPFLLPWGLPCPIDPFLPPFLPPWCLAGCPNGSFLPPWCLPGASKWSFPASLAPPCQLEFSLCWAAGRSAHPRICREPGRSPLKLY